MPIGLRYAPATFELLTNSIFGDVVDDFLVVSLDGIFVYSNNSEDHIRHFCIMIQLFKENALFKGKIKYELMTKHIELFGLQIGRNEFRVGDERKAVVRKCPKPQTISGSHNFAGLLQFLRSFIPKF